jgi:hypothetical protein
MSEASRQFYEQIKSGQEITPLQAVKEGVQAIAPGLSFGNILEGVKGELGRLGVQGQMELASAIFGNGAFVPYGPGQYTPSPSPEHAEPTHSADFQPVQQQERDGRDM